jgi:hypothetical protein
VIADLSVNFVERQALLCGYSVERVRYDYGYDLLLFTYNTKGEIERGFIFCKLRQRTTCEFGRGDKRSRIVSRPQTSGCGSANVCPSFWSFMMPRRTQPIGCTFKPLSDRSDREIFSR